MHTILVIFLIVSFSQALSHKCIHHKISKEFPPEILESNQSNDFLSYASI